MERNAKLRAMKDQTVPMGWTDRLDKRVTEFVVKIGKRGELPPDEDSAREGGNSKEKREVSVPSCI